MAGTDSMVNSRKLKERKERKKSKKNRKGRRNGGRKGTA